MDRWKSPIDLQMFEESFATKILEDQTGCVVETCVKMGVDVDKEELLKALNYDRGQYEKGYSDGRWARDSEIVRCKDCIHWGSTITQDDRERCASEGVDLVCDYWESVGLYADDFCSYGERKECSSE